MATTEMQVYVFWIDSIGCFFSFPILHWFGIISRVFECILAIVLLLVNRYKSAI